MVDPLLPGRYAVGAASVDAGGTIVTPTGATWTDNVWDDDLFFLPSQPLVPPQRIESVNEDGELVLAYPWPGAAATEEPYEVRFVGIIERSTAQSRRVLEQLGDVKAWADIFVKTDADRLALDTPSNPLAAKQRVLVTDDGVIWQKGSSTYNDWIGPAEFKGDTGNKGWSPVHSVAVDGARRVWQLVDWVGGEGTEPAGVGKYVGPSGLVDTMAEATDVRGPKGLDGTGTGDVVGPSSSTAKRLSVFADLTGKLLAEASGLTAKEKGQAQADIGAGILSGLRNKILNGDFAVFARHATASVVIPAATGGYGPDHVFISNTTNQPVTVSRQLHTMGQSAVPGSPKHKLRLAFANAPTSGTVALIQPVEDVATLAGLPFTMTAFVTGPAGTETFGASLSQVFGTGGSPSSSVPVTGTTLNIATIYDATTQKRTLTGTLPSVSGKTRGSNDNDYINASLTLTPRQAGNYEVSHWSLVEGDSTAEADCFAARHISDETKMLEWYYEETAVALAQATGASAITVSEKFRTPKRATPTVVYLAGSSAVSISAITRLGCSISRPFDATFTGVSASAELI